MTQQVGFDLDALVVRKADPAPKPRVYIVASSPDNCAKSPYQWAEDMHGSRCAFRCDELRLAEECELAYLREEAKQLCKLPFEKGDVVKWNDPASEKEEEAVTLYKVKSTPTVDELSDTELFDWSDIVSDAEVLIENHNEIETSVYFRELEHATDKDREIFYLANKGLYCPSCLSDDISGDALSIDEEVVTHEVGCITCGADWVDKHRLCSFQMME